MKAKISSANGISLILFLLVLVVSLAHELSHPLEKQLGLAHVEVLLTPLDALLVSSPFSLKFTCLFFLVCLVSFRATHWIHLKLRNNIKLANPNPLSAGYLKVLASTTACASIVYYGLGIQALTLLSSLLLLLWSVQVSHQRPSAQALALTIQIHNLLRLCCGGAWLLELTRLTPLEPGPVGVTIGAVGLGLISLSSFSSRPERSWLRFSEKNLELKLHHRNSRRIGHWEVVAMLVLLTLTSSASQALIQPFLDTIKFFVWSRILITLLEGQTQRNLNFDFRLRENIFRVGSLVWLSLPTLALLGGLPWSYEFLTIWSLVQAILIIPGMPWRGRKIKESQLVDSLSDLQRATLVWTLFETVNKKDLVDFLKPRLVERLDDEGPNLEGICPKVRDDFYKRLWLMGSQTETANPQGFLRTVLARQPEMTASLITQLSKGLIGGWY